MIGMLELEELHRKAMAFDRIDKKASSAHVVWAGDVETQTDLICKALEELASRRNAEKEHAMGQFMFPERYEAFIRKADPIPAPGVEPSRLAYCEDKAPTYDERDMRKAKYPVGSAVLDREFLFHQLRTCLNELGLVSISATDQTAFIAIRDILHAHAQDKSYDARYGTKQATNASKEQGRAFLEPSDKV